MSGPTESWKAADVPLQQEMLSHPRHDDEMMFEDSPSYQILKPRHDPADSVLRPWTEFVQLYSTTKGFPPGRAEEVWNSAKERDPPLLETRHRIGHGALVDLEAELSRRHPHAFLPANSTRARNDGRCLLCCCNVGFEVPTGNVQPVLDGQGGYLLAGAGVHYYCSPYMAVKGEPFNYSAGVMTHGDWCIVVVDQGFIGLAMDKGQPVLLPPGLHQWKSTTLKFARVIDLNEPVIFLGPYTLLTVDEGYAAVTQNNGRQEIKNGGEVHLLMHRNHKFEKFLTTKIQTDNLERIEVITGDNVLMLTDATVNWKIADPELAARNAAETMSKDAAKEEQSRHGNIKKLRNDVLQQASASLSSFIGTVNYSDSFSPNAQVQNHATEPVMGVVTECHPQNNTDGGVLFDATRMLTAVAHANGITQRYGVEIISINIISAKPADPQLMNSLALGAVAAAEAQQLETTAQGQAKAAAIKAKADGSAAMITAEALAQADVMRAKGAKDAAALIESSHIAMELAKIEKTGNALDGNKALFFGADPQQMASLLANPQMVNGESMR